MKIDIADIPKGTGAGARGKWTPIWAQLLALPPGKAVRWRRVEAWPDREFQSLVASLRVRVAATFGRGSVKLRRSSRADGVYLWLERQGAEDTPAQAA
jgi:hypothetical protein